MVHRLPPFALFLLLLPAASRCIASEESPTVAFRDVAVVDMAEGLLIRNQTVLITSPFPFAWGSHGSCRSGRLGSHDLVRGCSGATLPAIERPKHAFRSSLGQRLFHLGAVDYQGAVLGVCGRLELVIANYLAEDLFQSPCSQPGLTGGSSRDQACRFG